MKSIPIEIFHGDITTLSVDAIINAANSSLLGGGGVDGAIHRAAGPGLLQECKSLGGCLTGEAKITSGYNLPAKFVIHTVGPVWKGGNNNEEELLANCYRSCLRIAEDMKLKSLAFPNISTGVYGFPKKQAASVAIREVKDFFSKDRKIEKIIFAIFDTENLKIYKELLD
jgi:O-acetyl-ADP-ribose deacetylase (regulator of RNase III)